MSKYPAQIPKFQRDQIESLVQNYLDKSTADLISDVNNHVSLALDAQTDHPMVNVGLATLIGERIVALIGHWENLTEPQRFWVRGAVGYFAASDDEEDDFRSPIGFEDDAEIFNQCALFSGHEELVIAKEEY